MGEVGRRDVDRIGLLVPYRRTRSSGKSRGSRKPLGTPGDRRGPGGCRRAAASRGGALTPRAAWSPLSQPLTALAVVTSLAQAKLLAILLGPTGTGVVALAISMLALGTALAGLGISSALLKIVAEASDDKARAWQTYTMGLLTVTATGIMLSLVVLPRERPPLANPLERPLALEWRPAVDPRRRYNRHRPLRLASGVGRRAQGPADT